MRKKRRGPYSEGLKKQELRLSERTHGKRLILSTDESLDANEVVNLHMKKDSIEKAFRVLKTQEKVEPVRQHEHRVRAYLFVCMQEYQLISALLWKLEEASGKEGSWESANMLLHGLGRVERVEVKFGNEIRTWYLNVTKAISDSSREIGMTDLLKEDTPR